MRDLFQNENFGEIRVVKQDGEPWFVAKDICNILGFERSHDAVKYLDDDEKGGITNPTPGGNQEMTIISDAGFYSLVLRSRKPEAKAFKRWVKMKRASKLWTPLVEIRQ